MVPGGGRGPEIKTIILTGQETGGGGNAWRTGTTNRDELYSQENKVAGCIVRPCGMR